MKNNEKNYKKTMDAAVRVLLRRNHTKHELKKKLSQRGFDADIISYVISECERLRYVNDEETARFYLRELKTKGYGFYRIRFSLKKKGLNEELIENLLSEHHSQTDELENARRMMQKKEASLNREKDPRKRKEKIYRYLSSKGFSSSVISEVIHE